MWKILIYEDDKSIREELYILLKSNGYLPVSQPPCDLVLLDITMPNKSGYEICREIRRTSDVPIIFVTARSGCEDELIGFSVGADDFIRKPYDTSVLLARISRLLNKSKASCVICARELTLNLSSMTVEFNDKTAELSKNEVKILYCLMKNDICKKSEIIEELWNDSMYIDENTLGVNIKRLRDKLSTIGASNYIRTIRGVGYRL